jgi:hypothetical protein
MRENSMNKLSEIWRPEIFTLDDIVQSIFDFENLIRQKIPALQLPCNSPIETASLAALEIFETFKRNMPSYYQRDHRKEWRLQPAYFQDEVPMKTLFIARAAIFRWTVERSKAILNCSRHFLSITEGIIIDAGPDM